MERFLARLLATAPNQWLLKGGVALEFRFPNLARATKDLDLWMRESEASATEALIAATEVDLNDFFVFAVERTGVHEFGIDDGGAAVRYRLRADMAGREFETVVIDVGFGVAVDETPDVLTRPSLLAFADFEPIRVPALSLDHHVAEKLHAYTRRYGGEATSSRVKDLVDLTLIAASETFQADRLRHAIERTFDARASHPLPGSLPAPPSNWERPYARLADGVAIEDDYLAGHWLVAKFLNPILEGISDGNFRWNPKLAEWSN